jgi:putative FmdB family regulatory protein
MPIYAYRCSACGHAQDVLQKMSDSPLTTCPSCGAEAYSKQVTAAGFQLKGSGWYVTDFRGGNNAAAPAAKSAEGGDAKPAVVAKPDAKPAADSKPASTETASAPASAPAQAPAPAPAPSSSGS